MQRTFSIRSRFTRVAALTSVALVIGVFPSAAARADVSSGKGPSEYVVGAISPLSGPLTPLGVALQKSLDLFFEDREVGGVPIRIVVCDDGGTPDRAAACARKLVQQDQVDLVFGPHLSGAFQGAAPVLASGPPTLVLSPYVHPEGGTSIFQVSGTSQGIHDASLEFAKAQGFKKIGVLATTDTTGQVGVEEQEKTAKKLGLKLQTERIDTTDTSASTQLTALKGFQPDAIALWMSGRVTGIALQGLKQLEMGDLPVFIVNANLSTGFLNSARPVLPTQTYVAIPETAADPTLIKDKKTRKTVEQFRTDFQAKYGAAPDYINLASLDGFALVLDVLKKTKGDDKAAVKYLEKLKGQQLFNFNVDYSKKDHLGAEGKGTYQIFQLGSDLKLTRP